MLKRLLISVLLLTATGYAQPLPKPHGGGDYWIYNENTWLDWEVVSNELNGRLTPTWPEDEQAPGALLKIDWVVPRWPVVTQFRKGQRLRAQPDEVGGILIKDIDGGSWMKVDIGDGRFCFVRANSKYIKPVKIVPVAPPVAEPVVEPEPLQD